MDLRELAAAVVQRATMELGATAAEAVVSEGSEFSTVVRLGEVETLKEAGSRALGVRVFVGQRTANTSTSDLSPEGVEQLVRGAIELAKITSEDPMGGHSRTPSNWANSRRRAGPVLRRRVLALQRRAHRRRRGAQKRRRWRWIRG